MRVIVVLSYILPHTGAVMAFPAAAEQDLIVFFKGRCANPAAISKRSDNVKHLCGYDQQPLGWRGLTGPINQLPNFIGRLRLDPTDMDACATIADIERECRPIARRARVSLAAGQAPTAEKPSNKPAKKGAKAPVRNAKRDSSKARSAGTKRRRGAKTSR